MINEANTVSDGVLKVIDGVEMSGKVNVDDEQLLANIRSAVRRPHPQVKPQGANYDRIALVGGGPSLKDTEGELVELIKQGAKLVTMNGAYQWCIERNLFPKSQIVMDARPSNARFLNPEIPGCRYVLASQCAPETWDAVEGRSDVWMFHAASGVTGDLKDFLDAHYLGQWFGVGGGVTVATRAIGLLRTLGYMRFDLFGVDSCWMDGAHHAFDQVENQHDKVYKFLAAPSDDLTLGREFYCSPWHVKQFEDFLQLIRVNGQHFLLNVHGDGLLAYALRVNAELQLCVTEKEIA